MKGQVTDPEALSSIRAVDLQLYLRARGWKPVETTLQTDAVDWELVGRDGNIEVTVPRNARWRDYPRRVREVLAELSQLEGRSESAIAQDIQRASRDIIRMRAVVDGRSDGSIPLEDGSVLSRSARALMLAAACAAHEPRRAYGSRKPALATEYLRGLSMGQTEVGSFVLTILSPVPPAFTQQTAQPFDDVVPSDHYSRKVTRTLSTALSAVTRATEASLATGDLAPFDNAVAEGVSADLCESLGILHECTSVLAFGISIGWAPARPEPMHRPTSYEFTPDSIQYIAAAGRALRERSPVDAFEVRGAVIGIERQTHQELVGVATVLTDVDRRPRKVRIPVSGNDWNLAHAAVGTGQLLSCRGELTREGKHYVLRNPRDVLFVSTE